MKKTTTKTLTLSALFAAVIFVATAILPLPLGNGYANLGDTFIAVAAFFVGPVWGFFAAALGSCLADVFLGYGIYAPATFLIKGSMALVFILVFRPFAKSRVATVAALAASVAAEALMIGGYFVFECIMYSPAGAIPNISGNLIQGAFAVAATTCLISVFVNNKTLMKNSRLKTLV